MNNSSAAFQLLKFLLVITESTIAAARHNEPTPPAAPPTHPANKALPTGQFCKQFMALPPPVKA